MSKHTNNNKNGKFCFVTPSGAKVCARTKKAARNRMQQLGFDGLKIKFRT